MSKELLHSEHGNEPSVSFIKSKENFVTS